MSSPSAPPVHLTSTPRGDVLVIRVDERRLDARLAVGFKSQVSALVEGGALVVLDLSAVVFMDSSGLGALVGVLKQCGRRGDLALAGVGASVLELLKLTRMDRVFALHDSVDGAVAALGGEAA